MTTLPGRLARVAGSTYLLYADDSGDEADSFYSALLFPL